MKKLSILTTPAIALGVGILCAPQALAAGYTLNQTNLGTAAATPDTPYEGIFCGDGMDFCVLSEGDWTQEGNIDLSTVKISGTPVQGLVLQNNVNISNPDGGTFKGNINITDADEVTLNNLNVTGITTIDNADAEVTINGGTYNNPDMMGALNVDKAKSVTINGGDFKTSDPNGASAIYVGRITYDPGTGTETSTSGGNITITDGTFTSEFDHGIEFNEYDSLNISGGTFLGGDAGIIFMEAPAAGKVSLSGGTFKGTGADGKAISIIDTSNTAAISGMLAAGYHFSNDSIVAESGLGGSTYIAGTTSVVSDSASEEETAGEEAETTTSGIGSPDTGVYTAEEGSATSSSSILTMMATVLVALTGAILVKKHSKRA